MNTPNHFNKAYCASKGLDNLKVLNSNYELFNWHFKISEYEEDILNYKFWNIFESKYSEEKKIPLNNVIGTKHPKYHNKMWIEVLGCLSRFNNYTWDVNTFFDKYKTGGISFSKYGDNYYITGGNNRTTVAKFFQFEYLEAPVTEYFFDNEFYNIHKSFCKLGLNTELDFYSRESCWILKINGISVRLDNFKIAKDFLEYYKSIEINYKSLGINKINSYLSNSTEFYSFYKKEEFNSLKHVIISHKLQLTIQK